MAGYWTYILLQRLQGFCGATRADYDPTINQRPASRTQVENRLTTEASPVVVVNIVAASYSGSTWANLLLGANSQAFSVGEIDNIGKHGKALCTLHGVSCPIWSQFNPGSGENPYLQIHRITGKRFLVVNNARYLLHDQDHPRVHSKYIFLIRDGRAVVASTRRKYPNTSIWHASRSWWRTMKKKQRLIHSRPQRDTLVVRYEALLKDLEPQTRHLCEFLGMEFEPQMLEYWKKKPHFLGGNIGTMNSIAKVQGIDAIHYFKKKQHFGGQLPVAVPPNEPSSGATFHSHPPQGSPMELKVGESRIHISDHFKMDLDHYNSTDLRHFVDERWKHELSDWQLRVFAIAAGRLNRKFGYPPSLDRS